MRADLLVDRPHESISDDELDRSNLVRALRRAAVRDTETGARSTETVVGLTGPWGSGKSSILNYAEAELSALDGVFVVRFNPWLVTGSQDLIDTYFREITHQLGRSQKEKARDLAKRIDEYRDAIGAAASFAMPGANILSGMIPRVKEPSLQERKIELERKLSEFDGAIVVIVDELDRVEDQDIKELARFVKAVGDFPSTSYIIGYDEERVQKALTNSDDVKDGEEYLKKIVQVHIPIRPMFDYEAEAIFEKYLEPDLLQEAELYKSYWTKAKAAVFPLIHTPRDVKRIAASAGVYWRAVGREINAVDMVMYAVIASSSSGLRSLIANKMHQLVDDSNVSPSDWSRILGDNHVPQIQEQIEKDFGRELFELVALLFPRFREDDSNQLFGRVCKFENLATLLYLGDPPFRLSRKEIEDFWIAPHRAQVRKWFDENKLSAVSKRMEKLFHLFDAKSDKTVIATIAQFADELDRSDKSKFASMVDDMRWAFVRLGNVDLDQRSRVKSIFTHLVDVGDLCFVPEVLRHHMFAHGLADGFKSRDYPVILDKKEAQDLLSLETARYRELVLKGEWLTNFVDSAPFYVISQNRAWTPALMDSLSMQLEEPAVALAFSIIMAPPGVGIDRSVLSSFVDPEILASSLVKTRLSTEIEKVAFAKVIDCLRTE